MVNVLVIGETCVDRFVYGSVNRISPEAPVPIFIPIETKENSGMSGNVVENLKALADVKIMHITNENKITKTRFVDKKSNHMFMRVDEGDNQTYNSIDVGKLIKSLSEYDIVIVSDYNKGFIGDQDLIEISKNSKLSIIDSKRKLSQEIIQYFNFVKLNKSEYNNNIKLNHSGLIVTLGDEGAMLHDGKIVKQKNPQQTIDVSGAGDTFVASYILKYFLTKNIVESIEYANEVCGDVVSKKGVSLPDQRFNLSDQFSYKSSII
jgi:bifunctional ADP-heptose synthase (sugar kinase/adenylyltransferase)